MATGDRFSPVEQIFEIELSADEGIGAGSETILFDTVLRNDNADLFNPSLSGGTEGELTLDEDCRVEITGMVQYEETAGSPAGGRLLMQEDVGAGFADIPNARATTGSIKNAEGGRGSAMFKITRAFDAGDKIRMRARRDDGTGTLTLKKLGTRLIVRRLAGKQS